MSSSTVETWSEMPLLSETAAESDVFVFPVSFAQQRLWFLEQLDSESGQYNMATAVQIQGAIQTTVLQQSLQYLTTRHESLRTTFRTVAGDLMQVVYPHSSVPLTVVDGVTLSTQWQQWLVQQAQHPFDLAQTPLWRVTLLQLTPTEQILLLVMHHIISDGWSLNILVQELATVYAAIASGHPPVLPDLPIQYADFAIWQRDWLEQGERERQLQYWQQQLQGLAPLQLATDFPRPAIATGNGARQNWTLSADLTHALRQLSQQSQTTLYMTVLAVWQTLLYRYSSQDDIAVGSPIANRNQADTQGLIGCFVNTLVIRSCIREGMTFRQLLAQVKHTVLAAYEHQDLPFETLVEALQPERDLSRNPLFQVWFALNHASTETLKIPGLTWRAVNLERSTIQFDLSLEMVDHGQALTATIEYSTDLFQSETIARLWNHFQVLLAGILENPDTELATLPLLTPIEQQQVLWNWNRTQVDFPQHLCIHELFEKQAAQTPEAIAIVDSTQQLTYKELNHRANQLAHYLQQQGVRSETLVGLCLDRSVNLLVGILGILKAGGAYVPLDPAYPRDRLTLMLEDTQLSVLVTQTGLTTDLPIPAPVQVIELDRQWSEINQQPDSNVPSHAQPNHLAYLIYTSGSTGRAKGVMIEHRSLVNAYFAWETAYELRSKIQCHLQMASFSFDVFTGDWVRTLCSGGKLVLCPRDILINPPQLYAFIQQHHIDAAEFVPVVLRPLAQYVRDRQQRLDNFKLLVCGSDTWTWQDYQQIRQLCAPTTRLINSFGVTEATIDSSYFEAQTDSHNAVANLPIGRPFAN
ncbi:MAG TPA: condensation domain-containing protein, partial [Allocoleopsis sp.]